MAPGRFAFHLTAGRWVQLTAPRSTAEHHREKAKNIPCNSTTKNSRDTEYYPVIPT